MPTSHRPGQVRFEAWVPEDLFKAFQAKHQGSRKGWLVKALRDEVWGTPQDQTEHTPPLYRTDSGTNGANGGEPGHAAAE